MVTGSRTPRALSVHAQSWLTAHRTARGPAPALGGQDRSRAEGGPGDSRPRPSWAEKGGHKGRSECSGPRATAPIPKWTQDSPRGPGTGCGASITPFEGRPVTLARAFLTGTGVRLSTDPQAEEPSRRGDTGPGGCPEESLPGPRQVPFLATAPQVSLQPPGVGHDLLTESPSAVGASSSLSGTCGFAWSGPRA